MGFLNQPVNAHGNAVSAPGQPGASADVPGLDPIRDQRGNAKPQAPPRAPTKGPGAVAEAETLGKLLVPVSAAAGAIIKPGGFIGQKSLTFLTGFKAGEGLAVNKLTPGSVLFIGPEPIGALPERFFMSKPRIPGTNIFLDPLHNVKRQLEKREQRQRDEARVAQLQALNEVLPTLTTDQVRTLYLNHDLQREYIAFVMPSVLDSRLRAELDNREAQRVAVETSAATTARRADRSADQRLVEEAVYNLLNGDPYLFSTLDQHLSVPIAAGRLTDPFATGAPSASIAPEAIEPVADAAKRNQAAAKGIRKQLVSERADP